MTRFRLPCALTLLTVLIACVAGHPDGLQFHECTDSLSYTSDWTTWQLELLHNEPRLCPVEINSSGEVVYSSGTVVDHDTRDFASSRLIINTSSGNVVSNQVDYFQIDEWGLWSATMYANYRAGNGGNPCFDLISYRMWERYPYNPGSLPSASGYIDLVYPPYGPVCNTNA
jgi:hypothetical protein